METLKTLRKEKGLTQKELGALVGCSEVTICMYESGRRSPDYETLLKLSEIFDCTVDFILRGDDKKPLVNNDEELTDYLEYLRDREELRMLFSVTKDATKADIERAVAIIESLKGIE